MTFVVRLDVAHPAEVVTTPTMIVVGVDTEAMEAADTMTVIVAALATMTAPVVVHLDMVDVMIMGHEALTAMLHQGVKIVMVVVGTTTVRETIHQEIVAEAMEMHLREMPTEVETETILQMIGTPVAEYAC